MEPVREMVVNPPAALTSTEQELRLAHQNLLEMMYRISVASFAVNGRDSYGMLIREIPGGFIDDNHTFHFQEVHAPVIDDNRDVFLGLATFVAGLMGNVSQTPVDVWDDRVARMRWLSHIDSCVWHEFATQHAYLASRISIFLLEIVPSSNLNSLFDRVDGWNASRGLPSLISSQASAADTQTLHAPPCDVRNDRHFKEARIYASYIRPLLYDFIATIAYQECRG